MIWNQNFNAALAVSHQKARRSAPDVYEQPSTRRCYKKNYTLLNNNYYNIV